MNRVAMLGVWNGLLAGGCAVAALLFLKSHSRTRDRLFLLFSVSFGLMAVERLMIPLDIVRGEHSVWLYGLRLVAFVIIIYAIVDKNRSSA